MNWTHDELVACLLSQQELLRARAVELANFKEHWLIKVVTEFRIGKGFVDVAVVGKDFTSNSASSRWEKDAFEKWFNRAFFLERMYKKAIPDEELLRKLYRLDVHHDKVKTLLEKAHDPVKESLGYCQKRLNDGAEPDAFFFIEVKSEKESWTAGAVVRQLKNYRSHVGNRATLGFFCGRDLTESETAILSNEGVHILR